MRMMIALVALLVSVPADAAKLTVKAADGYTSVLLLADRAACSAKMCELWKAHACGANVPCNPNTNTTPTQLCPSKRLLPRSIVLSMTCTD